MNRKVVCKSDSGYVTEFSNKYPYVLEDITGIHETSGQVATVKSAFGIGSKYVGTSINDRVITITGSFQNEPDKRTKLYTSFSLNEGGTLFYYEKDIARKIEYQVESVQISDLFSHNVFQITLKCPSPYFTDIEETTVQLSTWKKMLIFPLIIPENTGLIFGTRAENLTASITNLSNIEIGIRIVLTATGRVVNPSIINLITEEAMKLNETLESGESIEITTYINQKNIYVNKDNIRKRKNNILVFGSKFLQLHNGTNTFKLEAEENVENINMELFYYNCYEAV